MIFVELSDRRLINLDQMAWINIQEPCPGSGSGGAACLHFGGRNDEALGLSAEELAEFRKLTAFGGYTATFGNRYIVNLQKISNIQIVRGAKPKVRVYFSYLGSDNGPAAPPLLLEDGAAREFLKNYRAYLNLP